ncbi:transmembrane protein 179B-like [Haliotis cracherodii]|uniref:transmembrane protein 179B-like n=1 Tax=Haliotis cracherodii TaxID=6455 RepID=UPI0039E80968
MPCIIMDVQLLLQTFLYAANVVLGFAVAVPLGITTGDFDGGCILYADMDWTKKPRPLYLLSHGINCKFGISVSVSFCILYGLGMLSYHVYVLTRKDPRIGSKMWVILFILLNSVITFVTFIASCMISVGLKMFCDSFLKGRDFGRNINSCADAQKWGWYEHGTDYRIQDNFYTYLTVTQIATWATFLVWVLQVVLGIIRFARNRRLARAQETTDLGNFASASPSA